MTTDQNQAAPDSTEATPAQPTVRRAVRKIGSSQFQMLNARNEFLLKRAGMVEIVVHREEQEDGTFKWVEQGMTTLADTLASGDLRKIGDAIQLNRQQYRSLMAAAMQHSNAKNYLIALGVYEDLSQKAPTALESAEKDAMLKNLADGSKGQERVTGPRNPQMIKEARDRVNQSFSGTETGAVSNEVILSPQERKAQKQAAEKAAAQAKAEEEI